MHVLPCLAQPVRHRLCAHLHQLLACAHCQLVQGEEQVGLGPHEVSALALIAGGVQAAIQHCIDGCEKVLVGALPPAWRKGCGVP